MPDLKLNPSQSEAIAAADAHLTSAGLPGYTELLATLVASLADFDAQVTGSAA